MPRYSASEGGDPRDCPYLYDAAKCYFVGVNNTELDNDRTLALIVEDIIQDNNLEASDNSVVWVDFQTVEHSDAATAFAFKDRTVEDKFVSKGIVDMANATVIDGVYIIKHQ